MTKRGDEPHSSHAGPQPRTGVPPVLLILRLQALVTQGALTGSTPAEWAGAMSALVLLGGLTTVAGGASMLLWAGTARWSAALTAFYMGLMAWALGMDNPADAGRR